MNYGEPELEEGEEPKPRERKVLLPLDEAEKIKSRVRREEDEAYDDYNRQGGSIGKYSGHFLPWSPGGGMGGFLKLISVEKIGMLYNSFQKREDSLGVLLRVREGGVIFICLLDSIPSLYRHT